jgi:putative membrane protein
MKSLFAFMASSVALVCIVPAVLQAQGASEADRAFVGKVSQGGMYEVEASKLAMQRATAPDVKDVATTEVHDHEGVNLRLKQIASRTGIEVSATLNPEFQQRLDKLKAVSGSDFDQAYIADMQQIHDKDEKLFAQEAVGGSASYKTFAHQTDLIVKRHIGALNAPDTL